MNDFEKSLRVDENVIKKVEALERVYDKGKMDLSFNEKIEYAVYTAILSIQPNSKAEEIQKNEYLLNINKYLTNYEEVRPLLNEFFAYKIQQKIKKLTNQEKEDGERNKY